MVDVNQRWKIPDQNTANQIRRIIEAQFLDLTVSHIKKLGMGWDNSSWLVNDHITFRFPKHDLAAELITAELKILPHLQDMNVNIPNPMYIATTSKFFAYPFYGHAYIDGTSLDSQELNNDQQSQLICDIATVLKKLHSFPQDRAYELQITTNRCDRTNMRSRLVISSERLDYLLKQNAIERKTAADIHSAFAMCGTIPAPSDVVLCHGDLYARHIILNDDRELSGIIDWGDCELLPASMDLRVLYACFPLEQHNKFWEIYGEVSELTKKNALISAIYISVTLAW